MTSQLAERRCDPEWPAAAQTLWRAARATMEAYRELDDLAVKAHIERWPQDQVGLLDGLCDDAGALWHDIEAQLLPQVQPLLVPVISVPAPQARITAPLRWQVDPTRVRRIGVVCEDTLSFFAIEAGPRGPEVSRCGQVGIPDQHMEPWGLGLLIDVARNGGAQDLWLLPREGRPGMYDLHLFRNFSTWCKDVLDHQQGRPWVAHPLATRTGQLAGLVVQGRDRGDKATGRPMGIYATWPDDCWAVTGALKRLGRDWPTQDYEQEFAQGLALASFALGAQLRYSPSHVGMDLLRQSLSQKRAAIPPMSEDVRDLVLAHLPTPVMWSQPIPPDALDDSQSAFRLYKYDRNSSYPASAGVVGVGDPLSTEMFIPDMPGFYYLNATPPRGWPKDLPGPFWTGERGTIGEYPNAEPLKGIWAWEPIIRLALGYHWHIQILEGYYWPKGREGQAHDLFRAWREQLWTAAHTVMEAQTPAGHIAKAIIKRCGTATIGRLKQRDVRIVLEEEEASAKGLDVQAHDVDLQGQLTGLVEVLAPLGKTDMLQPHWWATIIARANERLFAAMYLHQESRPVAAYVDACYCLHPWAPGDADLRDQLGKWKLERKTEMPMQDLALLNTMSPYQWVCRVAQAARADAPEEVE